MRRQTAGRKIQTRMVMKLASLMVCLELKRMSYAFQLLKQFYLFPEDSESSQRTVSKYDALIFDDQLLHAMVRKLETKLIENKIWGFINLKTYRYLRQVQNLSRNIKKLTRRVQNHHKTISFQLIKTYSYTRITTTTTQRIQITENTRREEPRGRLMTAVQQDRPRSRSGSIIRYEYDTGTAKRILLNGEIIPCRIEVRRSVSPMKEPEYIKISKNAEDSEDIRYIGLSRQQLQKKENLKYQYQQTKGRSDSRSRIICVERSVVDENSQLCNHCTPSQISQSPRPSNLSPTRPANSHKIIRLRSTKKLPSNHYLDHLT